MNEFPEKISENPDAVIAALIGDGTGADGAPEVPGTVRRTARKLMDKYSLGLGARGVLAWILTVPGPDEGLSKFERFLESPESHEALASADPALARMLGTVFAVSGPLSGRLAADPVLTGLLRSMDEPFDERTDSGYYRSMLARASAQSESPRTAVHRMHTTQLIRICARNADPGTPVESVTAELSALAEAVVQSCLDITLAELASRLGRSVEIGGFFVLGLGKLGGRELNVSSDIDLIYLCDEPDDPARLDLLRSYIALAERLTVLLTEATEYGYLYRVDTRLRADGASGPLVRTTGDYFRYLEMRGEAWERQMLIKARPVAGNLDAGTAFLSGLERFMYPTGITHSPNREIVALKNQIERRLARTGEQETHLKLRPGGIRDIEFIVQCLQLLMGGRHPDVRVTGTLEALDRLHAVNALTETEHRTLTGAYRLYRRIENALQWRELLPAFNLPEPLGPVAAFLGLPDLPAQLEQSLREVRAIYTDIFEPGTAETIGDLAVRAALNPDDEGVRRFLESLGFPEPDKSAQDLSRMVYSLHGRRADTTLHPAVVRFLPRFLTAIGELPDPGVTLGHFRLIADAYHAGATFFELMETYPKFFELLLRITQGSVFMTGMIVRDPSLLDWLVETGEILNPMRMDSLKAELRRIDSHARDAETFSREVLTVKLREKLRIGSRDISGIATIRETFVELTAVAEAVVGITFARANSELAVQRSQPGRGFAFAVVGAGKIGSGTMDFGSDLDLIFVYRGYSEDADPGLQERGVRLAQGILRLLTGGGGPNKVYEVDARLRPEGGNAPLAVSSEEYRRYLERRASVWERLALVRARPLTGTGGLEREVAGIIDGFVYGSPFTRTDVERIREIRRSMIQTAAQRDAGLINVKSGRGGAADIEFAAQSYAAHYGASDPRLRSHDTLSIITALGVAGILERGDTSSLADLYLFLRGVANSIRIGSGKPVNTLPGTGGELARVARLMGFANIRRFSKRLDEIRTLTAERYDLLMNRLYDAAAES